MCSAKADVCFRPDSDMHHCNGVKLRHDSRLVRLADCLSQGDVWPAETHRDPSGDKRQHDLDGVTIKTRHVVGKLAAVSSFVMTRISRGGTPGKQFRYIASQGAPSRKVRSAGQLPAPLTCPPGARLGHCSAYA